MRIENDFVKFLKLLNRNKVRYCIVGAYAVAFHAKPRYTKDLDILVEPTIQNGKKIAKALREFGFASLGLCEKDFVQKGNVIQLGQEPVRIDLLTSLEGVRFKNVWKKRVRGIYGEEKVYFIGLAELVQNKKVANRPLDKVDLEVLSRREI